MSEEKEDKQNKIFGVKTGIMRENARRMRNKKTQKKFTRPRKACRICGKAFFLDKSRSEFCFKCAKWWREKRGA